MALTLITTNTSSNDASSSFTSSIDSTYKLYLFKFTDVNPATDGANLTFQCNATDTADYNDIIIMSTFFRAEHGEDDSPAGLGYEHSFDLDEAADFQIIAPELGNGSDECCAGELFLFNPSSTTYVKHFYSTMVSYCEDDKTTHSFAGGFLNDATAIDDIQFKMSSGNMDAVIRMYGVA